MPNSKNYHYPEFSSFARLLDLHLFNVKYVTWGPDMQLYLQKLTVSLLLFYAKVHNF